ncbi:hypothetical protein L873DRAFT_1813115 [Choiromyces venosus 120613-1]|uniref:Mid2 domain-containing protein n=1 Tax=Choiromyces venosus 120613-1 TaxID=1336337 RepID=A0A3N4JFK1_9PEZI|nr:hypothetical protein L873DRAFT_1813115 [Choiromyces venosus 120613-1]
MACLTWLALLSVLPHARVQGADEEAFIGRGRVEHVGRVMLYVLDLRGERNSNGPSRQVQANATEEEEEARNKKPSEMAGYLENGSRTALLVTIGTLVPLSLLAIWVLWRMKKCPSGPSNDPERQVSEHYPTAYPLHLVSPPTPPPLSPLGLGSAIITPPSPTHQNGRNKQLPETKAFYTSSLTSCTGTSSTAHAKLGEGAEVPCLPIFARLKNQHPHNKHNKETNRLGTGGGGGGSLTAAEMDLTDVGMLQPVEMSDTKDATH